MNKPDGDAEILRRILAAIRAERVKLAATTVRAEALLERIKSPKGG